MQRLPTEPGGASAFISGREVLLAAVFLVLGGVILWFVVSNSTVPDAETLAAGNATVSQEAPQAAATTPQAEPAAEPEAQPALGVPTEQSDAPVGAGAAAEMPATTAHASEAPPPSAAFSATRGVASPQRVSPSPTSASTSAPSTSARAASPPPTTPASPEPSRSTSAAPAAARPSPVVRSTPSTQSAATAPSGGVTLSDLRVMPAGAALQIFLATDGLPQYNVFRVDNPNRVVIDMPGVNLDIPRTGRDQAVSHSVVQQIRVAQNQLDPPLVRLVLEVTSFPDLEILPRADGLMINVPGE